jgi:Arc/MetJ family transcription regulator
MRTNIVLNDDLVEEAMQYSTVKTKRALIEQALQTFVEVKSTERRRATYQQRLERLDAQLRGLRLRRSPADVLRADRDHR